MEHFLTLDLPTQKQEAWKYTSIRRAFKSGQLPTTGEIISRESFRIPQGIPADAHIIVFIDGLFLPELSRLPEQEGLRITPQAVVSPSDLIIHKDTEAFTALHHIFTHHLLDIQVSREVPGTLYLVHLLSGAPVIATATQRITIDKHAAINIVEYCTNNGAGSTVLISQTEIAVGENASCRFHKLQDIAEDQFIIDNTSSTVAENGRMYHGAFSFNGDIIRNDLRTTLSGQQSESYLDGLYLLKGNTHADNNTSVDHAVPNCYSNELYKGIIGDFATGVFNGRIIVRPDAQKTNAFQSNRNILMSEGANIYSRPQLEIFADDVKCSHGATSSRLDSRETFYMQSRGISKAQAEALLVFAFAAETLQNINDESVKLLIENMIANKLLINI